MHKAKVRITGKTPYSQGKPIMIEKLKKELPQDFENRAWRERLHCNENGNVFIPLMSIKNCIDEAAKFLSIQIPGKGKSTYTKHFQAGTLVLDHITLPIKKDEVEGVWRFVPHDGMPGGSKRVWKCFPTIKEWGGECEIMVLDDTITRDVFEQHVKEAGRFIGLGSFRPRNRGYYGRFEADVLSWEEGA